MVGEGKLVTDVSVLGCYGVSPDKATEDWMCSRCTENALEEVKFILKFYRWNAVHLGTCYKAYSVVLRLF
mgnify:CR=1 FL=1